MTRRYYVVPVASRAISLLSCSNDSMINNLKITESNVIMNLYNDTMSGIFLQLFGQQWVS